MAAFAVVPADLPQAGWRTRLPRLGNDRVILRELERPDAWALYRLVCDPEIGPQMRPPPTSVEAFEQFIECTWRERADVGTRAWGSYRRDKLTPPVSLNCGKFAHNGKFFDQNLWAIVAGLDEGSPSAAEASRSDLCPRVS